MLPSNKMKIALASRAYAESQGYTGARGVKHADANSYTGIDFANEFGIKMSYAKWLLACGNNIKNVPDKTCNKVLDKLTEEKFDVKGLKYSDELHPQKLAIDPDKLTDEEQQRLIAEIYEKIETDFKDMQINKLPPEMPTDIHVSNRLYSVEGKCKEIADFAQERKDYFKCIKEALLTIHPLGMDSLNPDDIIATQYILYIHQTIDALDTVITKLDKL